MISLRSLLTLTTVVAAALTLAACGDHSSSLSTGLQPGDASFNNSKNSSSSKNDDYSGDARLMLDKSGDAIFEFHTGSFDNTTNRSTPKGTLSSISYSVNDGGHGNRSVTTDNVTFRKSTASYMVHLDLCRQSGDDDDDDDGYGRASSCNSRWDSKYDHSYTAHIKGSDGHSSGSHGGTTPIYNLPDIDLSNQDLFIVGAGGTQTTATSVNPSVPTTFAVAIPNNKSINGSKNVIGAQVTCVVTVDGIPQLPLPNGVYSKYTNPNAFGYVGSAVQDIPAGSTGSCQFTLSLPAGTHKIVVTAAVGYPCDYDLSNNSTKTFTVKSAVSGPPDVGVSFVSADAGGTTGNVRIESAGLTAGEPVKLYVGVQLVSGVAPSTAVPCTVTITNKAPASQPVVLTGSYTLTQTSQSGSCQVASSYVFAAGQYSAVGSANLSGDPNAANNTTSSVDFTVGGATQSATVKVSALSFTDNSEAITNQQFQPSVKPTADTVHSGDAASYTATIAISNLVGGALNVPSVTCNAFVDTKPIPDSAWTTKTIQNASSSATCTFHWAINDASHTLNPHTIVVTATTGSSFKNNAIAADTTLTGTINAVQRIDVTAGGLQVLVAGVWKDIGASDAGIKQGTTDTIRTLITSHSPVATAVDCGVLGPISSSDATAAAQLAPTPIGTNGQIGTSATNVPVPANSHTAFCEYQVTAPRQSALISINMSAAVTPSSGQPLDQNPADNVATGELTVATGGAFTDIGDLTAHAEQIWSSLSETDVGTALSTGGSLSSQVVNVDQLALLVVPTQDVLGTFTLTGSVDADSSGHSTSFGTGVATGSLASAAPGSQSAFCSIAVAQATSLGNPNEAQLVYKAQICAQNSTDFPGYQRIIVSYNPSLNGTVAGSQIKYLFPSVVTVHLALDFTLTGSQVQNHVTATVKIPVGTPPYECQGAGGGDPTTTCSTNFSTAVVTTP